VILLSLGTLEVGRALLSRHHLSLAAFEAGRYAMVHSAASSDPATKESLKALVTAQFPGIDPAQLNVTAAWTGTKRPGDFVTITLEYPFTFLIEGLPTVTLSSTVTVILVS
jgi:Flp pilus assembly protein TadG